MKLGEIASVRTGLILSRKQANPIKDISFNRYKKLNLRLLNPNCEIDVNELDIY